MIIDNQKLLRITVDLDAALEDEDVRDVSAVNAEVHRMVQINRVEEGRGMLCEPMYMSGGVWQDCVAWNDQALKVGQDIEGRLWDVVYMAGQAQIAAGQAIWLCFPLSYVIWRVPNDGRSVKPKMASIVTVLASALDGPTVRLLMTPEEAATAGIEVPYSVDEHLVCRLQDVSQPAEQTAVGTPSEVLRMPLGQFIADFGDGLLEAVARSNPPVYDGTPDPARTGVMQGLLRKPFPPQQEVVQAVTRLLVEADEKAAIIAAEMGTGKTMMGTAVAAVLHAERGGRTLVISPPHLVYKWRREIKDTVPGAKVWVLNGPDTLVKLLQLREQLRFEFGRGRDDAPEFYILGRVRMRMGYHWRPTCARRRHKFAVEVEDDGGEKGTDYVTMEAAVCPRCGTPVTLSNGTPLSVEQFMRIYGDTQVRCHARVEGFDGAESRSCNEPFWTLMRPGDKGQQERRQVLLDYLSQLPTIGPKSAERLMQRFGAEMLGGMLGDNVYEFINLMDEEGNLVFSDRQSVRMERAMSTMEFSFGQGGYQATEFIKRFLPYGFFDLLVVDEGHEYKGDSSAQGQAMAVLATKARKVLMLTGTLMGGYADDLFYLLWRIMTRRMLEDGYRYTDRGSIGAAAMAFMRDHGVLKDIYKESEGGSHRTARGRKINVRTVKGPGFGPQGIARYVLPYTAFLKLSQIGGDVLPPYVERFVDVAMTQAMSEAYKKLERVLSAALKDALRCGDNSLLGVVLNCLLAWPDTSFRDEVVKHPRTRELIIAQPAVLEPGVPSPKEAEMIELCRRQKAMGRKVLVYTTYTGTRDTTGRLRGLLEAAGFKVAVLKASVDASKREDWIADQVERGVDVLVTNPELVKTGLDLLDFPCILFLQTGYNVYTLMQAARRSWRIGQHRPVEVVFIGYAGTTQMTCLRLMAAKIAVAQSTQGDMPASGLDSLNEGEGESIEMALARQLVA